MNCHCEPFFGKQSPASRDCFGLRPRNDSIFIRLRGPRQCEQLFYNIMGYFPIVP
jgi:hypothetical protein